MEYKLDALNIDKDGSYIFVSKNGREYILGTCTTIPAPGRGEFALDITVIFDYEKPFNDGTGETHPGFVNFFFGEDYEECARQYIDIYEEENKELLFGKKITQKMLDVLNEELLAKGCIFRYEVKNRNEDGSINTIHRVLPDNTWIDSYIINATEDFYKWFEEFFKEYGIEISYNNTGSICWANN